MKKVIFLMIFVQYSCTFGQKTADKPTLKSVLLEQMKGTHNKSDWFVCINNAIEGLKPEQAQWKDKSGNQSIIQNVNHLIFWNQQVLSGFKGEPVKKFEGENTETFENIDKKTWEEKAKSIDKLMLDWEKAVENADDSKILEWYPKIMNIPAHNAYHTGQIIYIRKMNGWWNPEKGVK